MKWAIDIRKFWQEQSTGNWKAQCFAYNMPKPAHPPYPGHKVIEEWLDSHKMCQYYERLYNEGNPVLEITFNNRRDALLFLLRWA